MTLKIYGISGLSPGNLLRVDYLPKSYRDNVYFQITGVTHNIGSTWDTTLKTVMRPLPEKTTDEVLPDTKEVIMSKAYLTKLNLYHI